MNEKIAILTDSGSDVDKESIKKYSIFVVPLQVIYKDRTYFDGVDIQPDEVYARLTEEVPKTSLPQSEVIMETLHTIKAAGYTHVLTILLSSGLSGTYNLFRLIQAESPLPMEIIDSKNIGIASGLTAIQAAKWAQEGFSFNQLCEKTRTLVPKTKVFFLLDTLKYLQLGGRIGKVSAVLGHVLELKPIITCNEEGVYVTASKTRGRALSLNKMLNLVQEYIGHHKKFTLAIPQGDAIQDAENMKERLLKIYPDIDVTIGSVSPALGVHTGPGLLGIAVQLLD